MHRACSPTLGREVPCDYEHLDVSGARFHRRHWGVFWYALCAWSQSVTLILVLMLGLGSLLMESAIEDTSLLSTAHDIWLRAGGQATSLQSVAQSGAGNRTRFRNLARRPSGSSRPQGHLYGWGYM